MGELRQTIHDATLIPKPERRYRAAVFQVYVLVASAAFVALAIAAHYIPYFHIDLWVTRTIQSYHGAAFDTVMRFLTWLGFQSALALIGGGVLVAVFIAGLRWDAIGTLFAAGSSLVGAAIKLLVYRPRPTADLVKVFSELPTSGFPSGHVLTATCIGGFLGFLVYTQLKPSWAKTAILALLALVIVLMGPSRIYMGQHWFSDVMGAYVFGSLWLALSIKLYRRGKFTFTQMGWED
jgi:undecaprenyl-diphosphatase